MAQNFATGAEFLLRLKQEGITDADLKSFNENDDLPGLLAEAMRELRKLSKEERQRRNSLQHSVRRTNIDRLGRLSRPLIKKLHDAGFITVGHVAKASVEGLKQNGFTVAQINLIQKALKAKGESLDLTLEAVFPPPETPPGGKR